MVVDLLVRRLFCDAADCARRTFAEQVEGVTIRYGRRTVVLVALVRAIALALAGRAGARLAAVLHIVVSRVTLSNVLMALPDPTPPAPRVLGMDDFARVRSALPGSMADGMEAFHARPLLLAPLGPSSQFPSHSAWFRAMRGGTEPEANRTVERP
ncbi:hypothetical protein [Streptomyces sp. NPDC002769]|uniref:hypothetical protein n=1 Tax=Streptomyces sp. NPDC002769 TaxID=3154542 RepID=UPI003320DEE5